MKKDITAVKRTNAGIATDITNLFMNLALLSFATSLAFFAATSSRSRCSASCLSLSLRACSARHSRSACRAVSVARALCSAAHRARSAAASRSRCSFSFRAHSCFSRSCSARLSSSATNSSNALFAIFNWFSRLSLSSLLLSIFLSGCHFILFTFRAAFISAKEASGDTPKSLQCFLYSLSFIRNASF